MPSQYNHPIYELTRGRTVESVHHGALAVVDTAGNLLAWYGDPDCVTYLRSSAKPLQILPFLENGGQTYYHLSEREIAMMCASHTGTDEHAKVLRGIQAKVGIQESDLLCGTHVPMDEATAETLRERKEKPTPNRHNCSGKHTGMLAFARMKIARDNDKDLAYIDPHHPIQKAILETFAAMCGLSVEDVQSGVDGCSAPNFAVPLRKAALAYARLSDPEGGSVLPPARAEVCRLVVKSMIVHPEMVSGPGRFDTRLMEVTHGHLVVKGGAEGYQCVGVLPGAYGLESPALGIAIKIADGDARGKVRSAVTLEVLRQLNLLSPVELDNLEEFGPNLALYNYRKIHIGDGRPVFQLNFAATQSAVAGARRATP